MNRKAWEEIADGLVAAIKTHVAEQRALAQAEAHARAAVLEERIAALEVRLAEVETKSLRRVA
jgi:hypothetical protein